MTGADFREMFLATSVYVPAAAAGRPEGHEGLEVTRLQTTVLEKTWPALSVLTAG